MKNKARKVSSSLIKNLLNSALPEEVSRNRNRVELACRIDDLIKSKGFKNYSEFAQKINRKSSEISKWLSGSHNFTIDTLSHIAFHLDVKLHSLFEKEAVKSMTVFVAQVKSPVDNSYIINGQYSQYNSCPNNVQTFTQPISLVYSNN